jgi:hypothetical protein
MPPPLYRYMHPETELSETEKTAVCSWVKEDTIRAQQR